MKEQSDAPRVSMRHSAWQVVRSAVHELVWDDLRAGWIDTRGLSRTTRFIIFIGFALLLVMVGALLWNDFWRAQFPLVALLSNTPGRGSLMPTALVPATLFLLTLAWSFALAGALHTHYFIRILTLLLYVVTAIGWTNLGISYSTLLQGNGTAEDFMPLLRGIGLVLLTIVFSVWRWRARANAAFEFAALVILVSGMFLNSYLCLMELWQTFGSPIIFAQMEVFIRTFTLLITPLLLLVGVNMASFAASAAGWTTERVGEFAPRWLLVAMLLAALLLRLWTVAQETLAQTEANALVQSIPSYLGALFVFVGIALVWWLITRLAGQSNADGSAEEIVAAAQKYALPLIVVFFAVQLFAFAMALLALAIPTVEIFDPLRAALNHGWELANVFLLEPWRAFVAILVFGAALVLARRGQVLLALFLGILSWSYLWFRVTATDAPLRGLNWSGAEPLDFWLVILLVVVTIILLVRRRLTLKKCLALLFLVLVTGLIRQTDFISNPFAPFLGFPGVVFIAFGIVYDAVTAGTWANAETKNLPRLSRIFLYLGYVLLTVAVINWTLTSHDLTGLNRLTGDVSLVGFAGFGKPLLYAIIIVTLARILRADENKSCANDA